MRKFLLFLIGITAFALVIHAQPYMVTATNYASGFFGVVADENGQPLSTGSAIHLIWDSAGDGMDALSTEPGFVGLPTDDDVLIGTCQVGFTGGAPSAGNFVLPGTAPSDGGWCYLRAFHAPTPVIGTFYSESTAEYAFPPMDDPVIYGIQFPSAMTQIIGETPLITINAVPDNPPIIIEPTGGSFDYTVDLINNTQDPVPFDVWIDVVLPNGSVFGPIISRTDLTLPPGSTLTRQLSQSVPPSAPSGVYTFMVHSGDFYTAQIIHENGFPFEKSGATDGDGQIDNLDGWVTSGWDGEGLASVAIPDVYFLAPPYPNPFNPTAQIQFGLPENSYVRIDVYNILGSRVTTLIDRTLNAGFHDVRWEAPNVASGLYLIQMKAGGYVHTKKAFLLK